MPATIRPRPPLVRIADAPIGGPRFEAQRDGTDREYVRHMRDEYDRGLHAYLQLQAVMDDFYAARARRA